MNVDEVSIAKSSRALLWMITFIIDKFRKSERFQIQSTLIGGIAAGKSKTKSERNECIPTVNCYFIINSRK